MESRDNPPPVGESLTVLPLTEIGNKTGGPWTLTLHPSHLALADAPGAQPYVILREQVMKSAILVEGTRMLGLQQPRKLTFKLTREGVTALVDWIGKPFLAGFYLKRRYAWITMWAFLWVTGSLMSLFPVPQGRSSPTFDLTGLVLGLALLSAGAFARWRPHPVLFLIDSVWFFAVAARLALRILHGQSKAWLVLVALLLWMAITGVRHFARFRNTRIQRGNP